MPECLQAVPERGRPRRAHRAAPAVPRRRQARLRRRAPAASGSSWPCATTPTPAGWSTSTPSPGGRRPTTWRRAWRPGRSRRRWCGSGRSCARSRWPRSSKSWSDRPSPSRLGPLAVLLPVKSFGEAKRRLAPALDPAERARAGPGHGHVGGGVGGAPADGGGVRRRRRGGLGPRPGRAGGVGAGAGPQPGGRGRASSGSGRPAPGG